ncbi:MAG: putative serine protease HtrA [Planctomycetes bacterium ADurb.Bin412]|nr:MAG: putative serine protease HtrA [Planctomycetes bacterium ADurb.Bin412]
MIRWRLLLMGTFAVLFFQAAGVSGAYSRITPVVEAFEKNKDAVVSITGKQLAQMQQGLFSWGFEDLPFYQQKRSIEMPFLGSGFVISPRGYIITNAHVVAQATEITIHMTDGNAYQAQIVAADVSADLAVLKIEVEKPLPAVNLGRSDDLKIGETVLAIGNPFGYQQTLTDGIISAIHREVDVEQLSMRDLIQISAPINPGNSGGPLLNINGEVIGINTAIRKAAQGIGFAIPIDWLQEIIPSMLNVDRLRRADLGLEVADAAGAKEPEAAEAGASDSAGVLVKAIRPGSAAHHAGFEVGDRITAVNQHPVSSALEFYFVMLEQKMGSEVQFSILRENQSRILPVRFAQRPQPDGKALARQLFGIEIAPLTEPMIRRYRIAGNPDMVVVTEAEPGGPADNAGIEPGDLLIGLNGSEIANLEQLGLVLEEIERGALLKITFNRTQSYFGYQEVIQYTRTVRTRAAQPQKTGNTQEEIAI